MTNCIEDYDEQVILIKEEEDNYNAQFTARKFAEQIGFDATTRALIATVVSELSTNILRYAEKGKILIRRIINSSKIGVEVIATDNGPGIDDVEKSLQENYSTYKGSLGLGLSSVKRIMDEFVVLSEKGQGTTIITRKWRDIDAA